MAGSIEELPNIGPVLAERLRAVGVASPDDLLRAGDDEAFARLKAWFPEEACYHTRLALAGAVRGIRHNELAPELKARLKHSVLR